jgi:dihydrofolate reductase
VDHDHGETWEFTNWIHQTCDAVVLGRKVYQDFLGFWPEAAKDESDTDLARHARWFRDVHKYVVSTTLTEVDPVWPHTTILKDVNDIEEIKQQPGKNLVIFGGIDITNSFAVAGLIDDYYIHVNPSIIPDGRLLLDGPLVLNLADVRTHQSGVLVLHYTDSVTG